MTPRRLVVLFLAALACSGCLRSNAQGDERNPNGPGSMNAMPHNTSGPGVKTTGGSGYYGSESWPAAGPAIGFGPVREAPRATTFATDEPGTSGAAPGTGNNGWGGPSDPAGSAALGGTAPWNR